MFNFLYPPAQNRYMQEKNLEELIFARIHVGSVFALVRIKENSFEELFLKSVFALWPCPLYSYSACIRISLVPIHKNIFGELLSVQIITCGTCIHTRANTGKYSWRIIYVLVSCQGVDLRLSRDPYASAKAH